MSKQNMVCRTNRLFWVGVCLIAVVCAVQAAEPAASKDKVAASPARLGKALTSEHAKAAPQAAIRTVTAAAVKPAAYRGKDSPPASHAYQAVTDTRQTRPGYNADYARMPTDSYARPAPHPSYPEPAYEPSYAGGYGSYPNANPGYQSKGYEGPDSQTGGYYPGAPSQPLRGYRQPAYPVNGHDKYPSGSYSSNSYDKYSSYDKYGSYDKYASSNGGGYNSMQQYPGAGYQQPYNEPYQGGYQTPSDPYSRSKPQPQEPYWHSYKQAGREQDNGYYNTMPAGSSYSVYGRERAAEHVQNQLALKSVYRVSEESSRMPSPMAMAPKVHQPTVLHIEDAYKQQQQQQLLSSVLNGNGVGSSGYGGAYKPSQFAMEASKPQGGAFDSQQWWKDHQQVQEETKTAGSTDKLDALLSIINKLAP